MAFAITACHRKKNKIDDAGFAAIEKALLAQVGKTPVPTAHIIATIGDDKKENTWEVIRFLESENRLIMNEDGTIQLA